MRLSTLTLLAAIPATVAAAVALAAPASANPSTAPRAATIEAAATRVPAAADPAAAIAAPDAATGAARDAAAVGAPADAALSCVASFSLWGGGYFATVSVHNGGSVTVTGWAVTFTLPANQQITGGWNAIVTVSGRKVVIQPGPGNTALAPGSTASAGFAGSYTGLFTPPSDMSVNGVPCTVRVS